MHVGDRAKIVIDWERRYQLMRLHFAAELILELTRQNFPGIEKIGAHIAQDKARIMVTEINERVVSLICFRNMDPFDPIAYTLTSIQKTWE